MESPKRNRESPNNSPGNRRQKTIHSPSFGFTIGTSEETRKPSPDKIRKKIRVSQNHKGRGSSLLKNMRLAKKSENVKTQIQQSTTSFKGELSRARMKLAASWNRSTSSKSFTS